MNKTWYEYVEKYPSDKRLVPEDLIKTVATICKEPKAWSIHLTTIMPRYGIIDKEAIAQFLANIAHESSDFNVLEENLNYSAKRLMEVWPTRFPTREIAEVYANDKQKLANKVYGDRLGNHGSDTNDGWNYRGSGLIQLTGRYNFEECAEDTGMDIVKHPEMLRENKHTAAISACWYWDKFVKMGTVEDTRKQINGGIHGLKDVENRYRRVMEYFREEFKEI